MKKFYLFAIIAAILVSIAGMGLTTLYRPNSNSQSNTQYTGYQVAGPYSTLRVEGSWIVPTANCTATPNSVSNISVIIDGISGEGDAMEVGTYQDCLNGVATYGAFVNVYPMISYYGETNGNISNLVIHPGDVVDAQGTWRNSTTKPVNWNTNFVDESTNESVDTDATTNTTFTPVLDSGALILSSDGHVLTSLSTIDSGKLYTGMNVSDVTGSQRTDETFGETANTTGYDIVAWQMPGTLLGPLTDDGSSFQISIVEGVTGTTTTSTDVTSSSSSSCYTTSGVISSGCYATTSSVYTGTSTSTSATRTVGSTSRTTSSLLGGSSSVVPASTVEVAGGLAAIVVVAAVAILVIRRK